MKAWISAAALAAALVWAGSGAPPRMAENHTAQVLAATASIMRATPPAERHEAYQPGRILVDLADGATPEDIAGLERATGLDLRPVSPLTEQDKLHVAQVPPGRDREVLQELARSPLVEVAEPDFVYHALFQPNDPRFGEQWHMKMIKAPEAWDVAQGEGVTVAVIDTGVAYEDRGDYYQVEDLKGVEFVKPRDFLKNVDHANDDHGHGTHVAGTIAQATNNGVGVAGVAFKARIMPLKVLDGQGRGYVGGIAHAIRYAADNGAQVINMSLGGPFPARVLEQACDYAKKKGVLVVCAAGNDGKEKISYPAAYSSCVAISAVRPDGELSWYSNYGKGLALAAPGGDTKWGGAAAGVLQNCINPTNVKEQGYFAFQGTSMASPHAAGAAALVISAGVKQPDKVLAILKETAQKKGDAKKFGAGIIDCEAAVKRAKKDAAQGSLALALAMGLAALATVFRRALTAALLGTFTVGAVAGVMAPVAYPVFATALAPVVLVVALFGLVGMRGMLAGFAVGVAAHLVWLLLNSVSGLMMLWLLAQAAVAWGLSWRVLARS